jgi:alcohol dehydrogenase class IV
MLRASRVYLIISRSLSTETDPVERLRKALGQKIVGIRKGMKPHTGWSEVVEIIEDARPLDSDSIITVGAGGLTDAAKVVGWALANDVRTKEDLTSLAASSQMKRVDLKQPNATVIGVPTTLSGGEYTTFAGATNDKTDVKEIFVPPGKNPVLGILNPRSGGSPDQTWSSTGVRSLDHCVDT